MQQAQTSNYRNFVIQNAAKQTAEVTHEKLHGTKSFIAFGTHQNITDSDITSDNNLACRRSSWDLFKSAITCKIRGNASTVIRMYNARANANLYMFHNHRLVDTHSPQIQREPYERTPPFTLAVTPGTKKPPYPMAWRLDAMLALTFFTMQSGLQT